MKLNSLGFKRPVQIGVAVADIRATAAKLSSIFSVTSWRFVEWRSDELVGQSLVGPDRGPASWSGRLAFAKVGPWEIELIEHQAGDVAYARHANGQHLGVRHVMFFVDDVDAGILHAEAQGIKLAAATVNEDGNATWAILDTWDSLGFDIEICLPRPS